MLLLKGAPELELVASSPDSRSRPDRWNVSTPGIGWNRRGGGV